MNYSLHLNRRMAGFSRRVVMNRSRSLLVLPLACGLATGVLAQGRGQAPGGPPPAPQRSITQVKGDLYMAKNNNHNTVFLVTPQGIVLGDPINAEFSQWLKGELAT